MPTQVKLTDVPAIVRERASSPHAANVAALRDFLSSGDDGALCYSKSDGVSEESLPGLMQALRNAAKASGYRLRLRLTSTKGHLYVVADGAYVPLSEERKAARAAARAKNAAGKKGTK